MVAVLQGHAITFFILAAGSFQRAFPEPRSHTDEEGTAAVNAAAMPESIARVPEQTGVRQEPWRTNGAASEPEAPQAQAASPAQVKFCLSFQDPAAAALIQLLLLQILQPWTSAIGHEYLFVGQSSTQPATLLKSGCCAAIACYGSFQRK